MSEVNYTEAMEATIKEVKSLNWESATALGVTLGRSAQSIVAKAKSLGVTYVAKERAQTKGIVQKKVYIKVLEKKLNVTAISLSKMTKVDILRVLEAVETLTARVVELEANTTETSDEG